MSRIRRDWKWKLGISSGNPLRRWAVIARTFAPTFTFVVFVPSHQPFSNGGKPFLVSPFPVVHCCLGCASFVDITRRSGPRC